MHYTNRSDAGGKNISASRKTQVKEGRTFFFDSFNTAHKFCIENNIDPGEIQAKYKSYKIQT